jgi:hypothetical protein
MWCTETVCAAAQMAAGCSGRSCLNERALLGPVMRERFLTGCVADLCTAISCAGMTRGAVRDTFWCMLYATVRQNHGWPTSSHRVDG